MLSWTFSGNRPIYAQIVEQIQLKILSGEYQPGQKVASIRDLAAEAGVNPNTMQKAMGELEAADLVFTQRTSGRFITEDTEKIAKIRRHYAEQSVLDFIKQMQGLGYGTDEMITLVSAIIKEENK